MSDRSLRILLVSRMFPFPPNRGERKRVYHLTRELSHRHRVTLVSRLHTEEDRSFVSQAGTFCEQTLTAFIPAPRNPLAALRRVARPLFRGLPIRVGTLCFPRIGRLIRDELQSERYDVVQLHHTPLAWYLSYLPREFDGAKVINLHNIETVLLSRMAETGAAFPMNVVARIDARRMRRFEPEALDRFDRVITVSDADRNHVRAWLPEKPVTTIDNGVDVEEVPDDDMPPIEGRTPELLYIGSMKYPPNENAVLWFASDVLPRIRSRIPGATLTVVGPDPSSRVLALQGPAVRVTGPVPAVLPHYKAAAVAVVPLHAGSGTRHKILEAMNYGVPVVTTTLGAEGLNARPGVDLEIADSAEEFAARVAALLERPDERVRLANSARDRVRSLYDWRAIGERLSDALCETVDRVRRKGAAA